MPSVILLLQSHWTISTKHGTKHPWVKGIQVSTNEELIKSLKINNVFFSSLNQRYDNIICVYWFELFLQVSDVAHGPLVSIYHKDFSTTKLLINSTITVQTRLTSKKHWCTHQSYGPKNRCFHKQNVSLNIEWTMFQVSKDPLTCKMNRDRLLLKDCKWTMCMSIISTHISETAVYIACDLCVQCYTTKRNNV